MNTAKTASLSNELPTSSIRYESCRRVYRRRMKRCVALLMSRNVIEFCEWEINCLHYGDDCMNKASYLFD